MRRHVRYWILINMHLFLFLFHFILFIYFLVEMKKKNILRLRWQPPYTLPFSLAIYHTCIPTKNVGYFICLFFRLLVSFFTKMRIKSGPTTINSCSHLITENKAFYRTRKITLRVYYTLPHTKNYCFVLYL